MIKKLVDRVTVDEYNHEYLMKNYQEGSRFRLFSNVFFGKMSAMSRANWWTILFCLPAIAAIVYMAYVAFDYGTYVPFSANFGLGYPVVDNAQQMYTELMFKNTVFKSLLLIPGIIIGCIGLSGAFNVIKYESIGFSVKITKTFFKGIKNNFVAYMWLGLINSVVYFALALSINYYGNPDLALAWKIVTITVSALAMAFSVIMSFYIMTQAALYDMPLTTMIKNAFWFTVSLILQNVIILVVSMVPVALFLLARTSSFMQLMAVLIGVWFGISYIVCVWTIYNHYVYGLVFTAAIDKRNSKPNKKSKKARQGK